MNKTFFLFCWLLVVVLAPCARAELETGMTRAQVVEALGEPEGAILTAEGETLFYGGRTVELKNGTLVRQDEDVEERAREREAERAFEAEQRAKGLVKHGDRWITPAEKMQLERKSQAARAPASPPPEAAGASTTPVKKISNGGRSIALSEILVPGKVTVVDFYADWCGPCRRISPLLEKMAGQDPDIVLRKVDIVKWGTDVTKQFGIRSVPNIRVFNRAGQLVGQPTSNFGQVQQFVSRAK